MADRNHEEIKSLFERLAAEGSHARAQLAWLASLSALAGAGATLLALWIIRHLAHTEIGSFLRLTALPFRSRLAGPAFLAILERVPGIGIGLAIVAVAAILAAVRYAILRRHTYRLPTHER